MNLAAATVHQNLPSAAQPNAFKAQNATATATAAAHFQGNERLKHFHKNALCVTYAPAKSPADLCMMAYTNNTAGHGCDYSKDFLWSIDGDNLPAGGIKTCEETNDPNEVCVPKGTVAFACGADAFGGGGLNVNHGTLVPSYMAVPQSTIDLMMEQYNSCYGPKPGDNGDKTAYMKTSSHLALSSARAPGNVQFD